MLNILTFGEVAERSNAAVLKTVISRDRDQGFESLPLLHLKYLQKKVESFQSFLLYFRTTYLIDYFKKEMMHVYQASIKKFNDSLQHDKPLSLTIECNS